jgi:manganese efflux pump family protein
VPLKLAGLILPLSLDTLAVSAAMGAAGLDRRARLRLGIVLALFEAGMPLLGLAAGTAVGDRIGDAGEWVSIAVLAAVGVWMLIEDDDLDDAVAAAQGVRLVALGLSVSLDELAIGLVIGLLGFPVALVVALIGAQAVVASLSGSALGRRLGEQAGEVGEKLAGGLLLAVAAALLGLRLTGHSV